MKTVNCIQGSPEWLYARLGHVTSSRVADALAKLKRKDGEAACRFNYRWQVVSERLSDRAEDQYVSAEMEWGTSNEPLARTAYEMVTGNDVNLVGFVYHPTIEWAGASPDGLVGRDGCIEIKCPKTSTHLQYLKNGCPPEDYLDQMYWVMACCERQWCDFISYDPRLPEHLQMFSCRLPRDEKRIAEMEAGVIEFLGEVDEIIAMLPKDGKSVVQHQLERSLEAI